MLRSALKIAALALVLLESLIEAWPRVLGIAGGGARGAFAGMFVLAWAGILAAAQTRPAWLRWIYALLFAAATIYVETYMQASRSYLTYDTHINLVGSAGALSEAVAQNGEAIRIAIALGLAAMLGIGLAPLPWLSFDTRTWMRHVRFVFPAIALLMTTIMFLRGGDGGKGLPAGYTGLAYTALERFETLKGGLGKREPVAIARSSRPLYRKIVLLIDESISGNYIDTGGFPGAVATPLTRPQPGLTLTNYGIVAAITNCSIGSNAALRFGGTRDRYLAQIGRAPSLWSYAKAAGLRTIYLDAQRTGGEYHDAMTTEEMTAIDVFTQYDGVPVMQRDMAIVRDLAAHLADPRPMLIIVNKMGAHFPVQDKYPEDFALYRPVPERGRFVGIGDTGSRKGFDGSAASWRLYRNAYRNTLAWNVGEFFRRVFADVPLDDALVIYTSDHGQDLHEDGRPGTTTHCQADPVPAEGAVPLVVIQPAGGPMTFTGKPASASHYRIGPTILAAMGYDRAQIRARYGLALDQGGADPGTFNTLFNARLGREPVWRRIEPDKLALPPASDLAP